MHFQVKGNALIYTIVISIILSIICLNLLLYQQHKNQLQQIQNKAIQKIDALNSGMAILLSETKYAIQQFNKNNLSANPNHQLNLNSKNWGLFEVASIKVCDQQEDCLYKSGLFGYQDKEVFALYLKDENNELSVAGNNKIQGTAYLPKKGVKAAYISSDGFTGDAYVQGNIRSSKNTLLPLKVYILDYLRNQQYLKQDSILSFQQAADFGRINNRFDQSTILIQSNTPIYLSGIAIKGNVVIYSPQQITIASSAQLEDILIVAPKVNINPGFSGSIHIISSASVEINNALLNYPSSIALLADSIETNLGLKNGSIVEGQILQFSSRKNKDSRINIDAKSKVEGLVYTNTKIDHKGLIKGTLVCAATELNTGSGIYKNHLMDAEINVEDKSKYISSSSILKSANIKQAIKWLN